MIFFGSVWRFTNDLVWFWTPLPIVPTAPPLTEALDILYQVSLDQEMKLMFSKRFPWEQVIDDYLTALGDEEWMKKVGPGGACKGLEYFNATLTHMSHGIEKEYGSQEDHKWELVGFLDQAKKDVGLMKFELIKKEGMIIALNKKLEEALVSKAIIKKDLEDAKS